MSHVPVNKDTIWPASREKTTWEKEGYATLELYEASFDVVLVTCANCGNELKSLEEDCPCEHPDLEDIDLWYELIEEEMQWLEKLWDMKFEEKTGIIQVDGDIFFHYSKEALQAFIKKDYFE